MRLRKAIKKIIALGTGATMMGATLMGAMAADLANYPAPFIKDGAFSGVMVIGDKAAAEDVVGVSDIAVSLQFAATSKAGTASGAATVVTGDVFKISASGDDLNLFEEFRDVVTVVDKDDLDALKSGSVTNNKGTYSYDQYLTLGNSTVWMEVSDESGVVEDPKVHFKAREDVDSATKADETELFVYKVSFPTAMKSDIDSSRDLDDFDDKKITMLGKEYTFTDTDFSTAGRVTLDLMGGAVTDTLEEGESKTYTIDGVTYELRVDAITDTAPYKVKFTINSEVTDALEEGQTYTLADKSQIGIKEILPNEAGDVTGDTVSFYLGAQKIELQDTNISAVTTGYTGKLTIGSNLISSAFVDISGSNTSDEVSLSTIEISWQLDDNYYVPAGDKLTQHLDDQDDLDFASAFNIDVEFAGLGGQGEMDVVELKPSGSSNLKLTMTNKAGNTINEEVFYTDGSVIYVGKATDKQIKLEEGSFVNKSEYFIVEASKYSHLMQLKKVDTTNYEIEIKDIGSGDTDTISYDSSALTATLYKDGYSHTFANVSSNGFTTSGITDDADDVADLWTQHEHEITLFNSTNDWNFNITEAPDVTRDDSTNPTDEIAVNVTIASSKITPNDVKTTSAVYNDIVYSLGAVRDPTIALDSDDNKEEGMTRWGTFIEQDTSGDQDSLKFTIPEKETIANVYVTAGVTTQVKGSSEGAETVTIQRIEVGATKLASEVAGQEKSQNMILVGGPCANAAAAVIMGSPADCTTGFEPGKGMIQLFENDGNVAMLVAGYSATDTRAATSVVANYGDYTLKGTKMEVTTATSTVKEVTTA